MDSCFESYADRLDGLEAATEWPELDALDVTDGVSRPRSTE